MMSKTKNVVAVEPIFLDRSAAAAVVSLSEPTIERLVREGAFPAPRKVSGNRVAWLMSELREWCAERPVSDLLPPKNAGKRRISEPASPASQTTS
jgi:prophage regulatory protein